MSIHIVEDIKSIVRHITESKWFLPVSVFIIFLTASWLFYGPAYLSDEVGYLDKAATLAGSTVHVASSWYGGYSILISPAFFFSHDPYTEWRIISVLNALMWAISAVLLRWIIKRLRPKLSVSQVTAITALSLAYPSWIAMSGYAFSTSGFVLVFLASLACLIKSDLKDKAWLLAAVALGGFVFWIHLLGVIYVFALFALLAVLGGARKDWRLIVLSLVAPLMTVLYLVVIAPAFNTAMGSLADGRYSAAISTIASNTIDLHYIWRLIVLIISLAFACLVSTFGVIIFAARDALRSWSIDRRKWLAKFSDIHLIVPILLASLVAGTIIVNAISSAPNTVLRLDEWIYGRYTDLYIMPVIALGLAAAWSKRDALAAGFYTIIAGLVLWYSTSASNTDSSLSNKVNILSFWPMQLTSVFHLQNYLVWAALGALGIGVVALAAASRDKRWALILLLPIVLTNAANLIYHRTILTDHSTVSSLYSYAKTHYSRSDCIGFTTDPDTYERFSLYSYYLHGYNIEQMPINTWLADKCAGPYFTYDATLALQYDLTISGREEQTGLLMLTHQESDQMIVFR